jgi:uncharacterized membrane protein
MEFIQGLTGSVLEVLGQVPVAQAIFGFLVVFFMPGFAWTFVMFKTLNPVERIALSFGISIAFVTLSVLGLNLALGVRITAVNALLTIALLTVIPVIWYFARRLITGNAADE